MYSLNIYYIYMYLEPDFNLVLIKKCTELEPFNKGCLNHTDPE